MSGFVPGFLTPVRVAILLPPAEETIHDLSDSVQRYVSSEYGAA
jgi:hypothetical protein